MHNLVQARKPASFLGSLLACLFTRSLLIKIPKFLQEPRLRRCLRLRSRGYRGGEKYPDPATPPHLGHLYQPALAHIACCISDTLQQSGVPQRLLTLRVKLRNECVAQENDRIM